MSTHHVLWISVQNNNNNNNNNNKYLLILIILIITIIKIYNLTFELYIN